MSDIQKAPEHVNLTKKRIREHMPVPGDYYAAHDAHYVEIYRILGEDTSNDRYRCERIDPETGSATGETTTMTLETISEYYRWIDLEGGSFARFLGMARAIVAGNPAYVMKKLSGEKAETVSKESDVTALTHGRSRDDVAMMLDEAEQVENRLQQVQLWAKHIMNARQREIERRIDEMNDMVAAFQKKVNGLLRVITIMNLYLGRKVDVRQIAEGEGADPKERLAIRQRILYMDEELCAHLDHEADYKDIDLFFEWVTKPENRDIVIPEKRCVVTLKPKRFSMDYRSGDPFYDAQRDQWNKHTYLLIRNGDNLWVMDDSDLECYDWVFPHSDFEYDFQSRRKEPFYDSRLKEHENERYRVMRMMMFLQGLVDRNEVFGVMDPIPNIIKTQGVDLIRDDELAIGTGIKPWLEFVKEKNALIRRGTRIIYDGGNKYFKYGNAFTTGGEFARYYQNKSSEPGFPDIGLYHVEIDNDHRKPYFLFNPGGDVWPKNNWEQSHERIRREAWYFSPDHVINYDAITTAELQAYFDDRTLRKDFRNMMPLLKKALLEKKAEEKSEDAFKTLMVTMLMGTRRKTHHADQVRAAVDAAVAWWKEKVIYTRPLSSDDAKAWRMVKAAAEKALL